MANFDVKEVGIDALFPDKDEDIYKQQGINKMCTLVRTALCDEHIHHLQFNCQDKKVLLDAQIHPEKISDTDGSCSWIQRLLYRPQYNGTERHH